MYLFHVAIAICVFGAIEGNRHGNHHPHDVERQGAGGGATDQCPSPASLHCSSVGRSKHPHSCNTTVANSCRVNKICCPTAPNDNHQGCCVPEKRTAHAGGPTNNGSVGNGQPPKSSEENYGDETDETDEVNDSDEEKEPEEENETEAPEDENETEAPTDEGEGAGDADEADVVEE